MIMNLMTNNEIKLFHQALSESEIQDLFLNSIIILNISLIGILIQVKAIFSTTNLAMVIMVQYMVQLGLNI